MFATVVILLAVSVGLFRIAVNLAPEYRQQIEGWASGALGYPVVVGAVDLRFTFSGPQLLFRDARIFTRGGERELIRAARGELTLHPWSLITGRPRPSRLGLTGVALRLERGDAGDWRLLGPAGPGIGEGDDPAPRLDDMPDARIHLEDVRLELHDRKRGLGPWQFAVSQLDLRLAGERLSIEAQMRLPTQLGFGLSLSANLSRESERGVPLDWSADIEVEALELGRVREALDGPAWMPAAGILDATIALDGERDRPVRVLATASAADVRLPPPDAAAAAGYERVSGQLDWQRLEAGWRAELKELAVRRGGRVWQTPAASLQRRRRDGRDVVDVQADFLLLEDVAPLAAWLPSAAREAAAATSPRGEVRDLTAQVVTGPETPPEIRLDARFEGIATEPWRRLPGIRGFSGDLAGTSATGTARVQGDGGALSLPYLFREPLEFDDLDARIEWVDGPDGLVLRVPELVAENADAAVEGRAEVRLPSGEGPPQLDIEATARNVMVAATPRYLPVGIMPDRLVEWIDRALVGGQVPEAQLELRGPTRGFPYRRGEGVFRVAFGARDVELAFAPGWPAATGVQGEGLFENAGLSAQATSGRLMDVEAGTVSVRIPDLLERELHIEGAAQGSLAAMRSLALSAEHLANLLRPGLEPLQVESGQGHATVDLLLPLGDLDARRIAIDLDVEEGVVAWEFLQQPARDVQGSIRIRDKEVTSESVTATLAGHTVRIEVAPVEDGATRVTARGRVSIEAIDSLFDVSVAKRARGETDWLGYLHFPAADSAEPLHLHIWSELEGVALDWPQPFSKAAHEPQRGELMVSFPGENVSDWRVNWGAGLEAAARVDGGGDDRTFTTVPGIAPAGSAAPGVVLSGTIPALDIDGWLRVDRPAETGMQSVAKLLAGGTVMIDELTAGGSTFGDVSATLARGAGSWSLALEGEAVAGTLELPYEMYGERPLTARLQRLWLGGENGAGAMGDAKNDENPPPDEAARVDPAVVPSLDLQIEDFRYGGLRLGSISVAATHLEDGFELEQLEGGTERFVYTAQGHSRRSESIDDSSLTTRLSVPRLAPALRQMGAGDAVRAVDVEIASDVAWQGGLRADWLEAIVGTASLRLGKGTLPAVEPGAGRVFGLLSLQALPRRLTLDFSDVFRQGLSFDAISGDFELRDGNAWTSNLLLRGPTVNIAIVGRTGLVERDYDQTAVISTDFGITLPVAGAVVGGPAVGAALYLLSEVLRKPLRAQVGYRITGNWDDPEVERVAVDPEARDAASAPAAPAQQEERGGAP